MDNVSLRHPVTDAGDNTSKEVCLPASTGLPLLLFILFIL
jgi:hypothetical protein